MAASIDVSMRQWDTLLPVVTIMLIRQNNRSMAFGTSKFRLVSLSQIKSKAQLSHQVIKLYCISHDILCT